MWRGRPGLAPRGLLPVWLSGKTRIGRREAGTASPPGNATRWRRRPDDPRTAWGWTFRHNVRFELVRRRFEGRMGAFRALVFVAVPTVCLVAHKPMLVLSFFGPWVGNLILMRRRHAEAHGALPTLFDAAEAPESLPVTMTLTTDRKKTAREVGWLSLADGWLVFEGLRTTVALAADAAERAVESHGSVRFWIADGRGVEFALLTEAGETTRPAAGSRRREVAAMVRAWQSGPCPEGESVLPPTALHPEIVGDRAGRAFLWAAAFAPLALLVGVWGNALWGLGFGGVAATALAVFFVRIVSFGRALPSLVERHETGTASPPGGA